jgi:hypothetical protein
MAANWTVSFAIGLAALFFLVKMVANRRVAPIDVLSGFAELPSDISAACLSLAAAYLWLANADDKLGSIAGIFLTISFVLTTCLYRYIDTRKLDFQEIPFRISLAIISSYLILYFMSIKLVIEIYSFPGAE